MNEQKAFWKGFVLASGLAIVFMAGRVSAAPEKETVDDVSSNRKHDQGSGWHRRQLKLN